MSENEVLQIGLDLGSLSREAFEIIFSEQSTAPGFYREAFESCRARRDVLLLMLHHFNTPDDVRRDVSAFLGMPPPNPDVLNREREAETTRPAEERALTLYQTLQRMKVGDRIQLAMRGGRDVRNLLIKDSNREVVKTVMANPKLTESEIELIAKNRNISEDVLRIIAKNREWVKSYAIILALVTNPKTPPGVSMNFISRINKGDLLRIEKNKNVPELVRAAAKRLLAGRQQTK